MVIPREAGRTTYSAEIRKLKKNLQLTAQQRAFLVGTILGDGHLAANWSKTQYALKVSQSKKQSEYVWWKYDILKDWVLTKPKAHKLTSSLRFGTVSHPALTEFHGIFYKGKKKVLPENLDRLLSPFALAVWYMDDGNIRTTHGTVYGYYLNTQSFTHDENMRIAEVLHRNYKIRSLILKNHGGYRIYIGRDRKLFADLVQEYVIPSMQYKLG